MSEPDANSPDNTPIEEFYLSARSARCLIDAGYKTAGSVRTAPDAELLRIRGFGRLSLKEIREVIGPFRLQRGIPPVMLTEALPTMSELDALEARFEKLIAKMEALLAMYRELKR